MTLAIIIAVLVIFILVSGTIWIGSGLIGLILHLVMAGLIGTLADVVVPGRLPWGWVGAVVAGLLGSWLGVRLIGSVGPALFGVPLFPAFVGALVLAVIVAALAHLTTDRSRRAF